MTGLSVAAPVGVIAPNPTGPEFNAFVLLPASAGGAPTATPTSTRHAHVSPRRGPRPTPPPPTATRTPTRTPTHPASTSNRRLARSTPVPPTATAPTPTTARTADTATHGRPTSRPRHHPNADSVASSHGQHADPATARDALDLANRRRRRPERPPADLRPRRGHRHAPHEAPDHRNADADPDLDSTAADGYPNADAHARLAYRVHPDADADPDSILGPHSRGGRSGRADVDRWHRSATPRPSAGSSSLRDRPRPARRPGASRFRRPATISSGAECSPPPRRNDTFYVRADGGAEDIYDVAEGTWGPNWQWTRVNGRGTAGVPLTVNPRKFAFSAGSHTIRLRERDPLTRVDRVIVTNDFAYVPTEGNSNAFGDTPPSNPYYEFIENLARNEITGGCGKRQLLSRFRGHPRADGGDGPQEQARQQLRASPRHRHRVLGHPRFGLRRCLDRAARRGGRHDRMRQRPLLPGSGRDPGPDGRVPGPCDSSAGLHAAGGRRALRRHA